MTMWIILAVIAAVAIFWVTTYNRLVKLRVWTDESFSQVDVQLQRRNDLIPNLVETVKGYAKHEASTLEEVVAKRQQLMNISPDATPEQINAISNQLTGALSRLLAVAESYPELKANTNFTELQHTLADTEDKIAKARQLYNSSIGQYNAVIQTVPTNFVANVHGFTAKAYLEATPEQREVPKVEF